MDKEMYDSYTIQDVLQKKQAEAQSEAYAPQVYEQMQQAQAVLVDQTNPRKIVENIMLRLRGRVRLPDGREKKMGRPKMNDKGVEAMWFILDSHINQNVILSHLDEEEIGQLMNGLQEDLVDDLALNWKNYGIVNKTDLDTINNSILMNVFLALKRAEGQNEKNWLGRISMEHISGASNISKPRKESIWSKFRI